VHGKRKVMEPDSVLSRKELARRVRKVFDCDHHEHLSLAKDVA
jgi:hypothetical protein